MTVIAFDVDDTLVVPACATGFDRDVPNYDTIAVYRWLQAQGHEMVIWSGGGANYARVWADRLGLVADYYEDKRNSSLLVDLAFDDSDLELATVNLKVRRINNKVVRYPGLVARKS